MTGGVIPRKPKPPRGVPLLLAVGMIAPEPALAEWVQIAQSEQLEVFEIEPLRITLGQGKTAQAWMRSDASKVTPPRRYAKTMQLFEFDCDSQPRMRTLQSVTYGFDGEVIAQHAPSAPPFLAPIPDSIGEAALKYVCNQATLRRDFKAWLSRQPKK